jgi:hypothetical protein
LGQYGKYGQLVIAPRHILKRAAASAVALICTTTFAAATCRLALVLAIDVSNSVDATEDILQRNGLANALIAPEVQQAMFASDFDVALAVFEWSGRHHQQLLFDWTLIDGSARLLAASNKVRNSIRGQTDFPTALGHALDFAVDLHERAPSCLARTIDVAGDGKNNDGYEPSQAYAQRNFDGITVNGLVIRVIDLGVDTGVLPYYKSQVIRGPGAFTEVADRFEDYERAMRRKLERELAPAMIGALSPTSGGRG